MTLPTFTGCMYSRNSAAQEKSIADQTREGHEDAADAGIKIIVEYGDGKGASQYTKIKRRDDWDKVLADVETRAWDVLCLWEPSRGDRKPEDWARLIRRCEEQGILIRLIGEHETYDPRKTRDYDKLLDDGRRSWREIRTIKERVEKGIRGAVHAGTPLGREQFGYTRTKDRRGKVTGQVPDDNAAVVREIFALLADGVPGSAVAAAMTAKGYPAPGKAWTNATIRDIGRRRAYVGLRKDPAGQWVPGGWEPIVSEPMFWAVQRIMDKRAEVDAQGKRGREGRVSWLLSGIATCGVCGKTVAGSRARGMYVPPCGHVAIVAKDLDAYVTAIVVQLVSRPDVYASLRQAGQESDAAIVAARTEIDRLAVKLDEARAALAADRMDLEDFVDLKARLKPLVKAAREKMSGAAIPPAVRGLVDPGVDVAQRWEQMPLAARRDVIRVLMSISINKSMMVDGGWLSVDERVTVTPR